MVQTQRNPRPGNYSNRGLQRAAVVEMVDTEGCHPSGLTSRAGSNPVSRTSLSSTSLCLRCIYVKRPLIADQAP